jgi:hypothetical protein
MLKFAASLTLVLLSVCAGRSIAAAQTHDDVILIPRGEVRAIQSKNLAGAFVGDINVAYIHGQVTPTEVFVYGHGIGETALELTRRDGQRKRLLVRVLPVQTAATRALPSPATSAAAATGAVTSSPNTNAHTSKRDEVVATDAPPQETANEVSHVRKDSPQRDLPRQVSAPARVREEAGARASRLSRLEISAETFFLFDREDVRALSPELLEPSTLRAVVSDDAVERRDANARQAPSMTIRRSSVVTPLSIKYDINARDSLTVVVPYVSRRDEIKVGSEVIKTSGRGLGDVQVTFSRDYPRLFKSAWESTVESSIGLPTGKSIYNTGKNSSPLGIGHYEIGGQFSLRRTFDPLTINAAMGVNYAVPRMVEGTRIAPGIGYSAQTGFGYALTDRWAFTEQLDYTRRPNVFLVSPTDAETVNTGQSYLSHGMLYNTDSGHTFRMMFNLGLNPASSDYGLGFTYSYRRKNKTSR